MTDVGEKLTVSSVRINLHDGYRARHDFLNNSGYRVNGSPFAMFPMGNPPMAIAKGISLARQYSIGAARTLRVRGEGIVS